MSFEAVGMFEDLLSWGSQATHKAGIPGGFPSTSSSMVEVNSGDRIVWEIFIAFKTTAIYVWVHELEIIS